MWRNLEGVVSFRKRILLYLLLRFFCADDDDSVDEGADESGRWGRLDTDYAGFCLMPKALMDPNKSQLFCHIANHVACNHGHQTDKDLVPSAYLDLEVASDIAMSYSDVTGRINASQ